MDNKSHEKLENPPDPGERQNRPRLRLIHGERAEGQSTDVAHPVCDPRQARQVCSDDDDDDHPPSAA
jgi:hypothetical protein